MNSLLKRFKKLSIWTAIFALIIWTIGMPISMLIFPVKAASNITISTTGLTNSSPNAPIKASSSATAIARLNIFTDQASKNLFAVTANFSGSGFSTTTDIAALGAATSSGVALYDDIGGSNVGYFGTGDLVVIASSTASPVWSASNTLTIIPNSPVPLIQNATNTFYLVIKTAGTAVNNHQIIATIPTNGVITSDGNGPAANFSANSLVIDAQAPSIIRVEKINPSAVEVMFSENVQPNTAIATSSYAFNGGFNVMEAFQQGPNIYRVTASGNILIGTTTLTVNSNVLDLAGNANASTSAVLITEANKVKISEVMVGVSGANVKEFVELYNGGENIVNVSNYKLHIRQPDGTDTNKTLSFATSTIPAFGYFLIASQQYTDISMTPDATYDATANDLQENGAVYISNSATADTQIIDKVGWGAQASGGYEGTAAPSVSLGQSLERKAVGSSNMTDMASGGKDANMGNGFDSSSNSFDFLLRSTPQPQNNTLFEQPNFGGNYQGPAGGGPMIMHMPVNLAPTGSDLNIIAQMGDPQTPINQLTAELHYMVGDGSPSNNIAGNYTTLIGSHQANGFFRFTIPQAIVDASTANGVYYYLKLIAGSGTRYMSASPSADMAGNEAMVVANPFITNIQNSSGWTKHNITGTTITSTSTPLENVLVFLEGTGYSTSTAANGAFALNNVKDGNYNLIMMKESYYDNTLMNLYLNNANFSVGTTTMMPGTGGGMTGDTTKPYVKFTGPPDGMTGVPSTDPNFKVFIGFSKDMSSSTINNSNIYLSQDGSTPISSTVSYDNDPSNNSSQGLPPDNYLGIVTAPAGGFSPDTTYYLIMTGEVRDTSGNSLQGNRFQGGHVVSFSTGGNYMSIGMGQWTNFGQGAMMPPFVMGATPFDGSMNIAPNIKANVNFSDPMDSTSVTTGGTIKLYKVNIVNNAESNTLINTSASLDTSQKIVTLTPTTNLSAGKYRIAVSGAVKSATGIFLGDPNQNQNTSSYDVYRSHFEVGANTAVDITKPTISGTWPTNNATDISVSPGLLNIQFSEGMDPTTINSNTITLKRGSTQVTGVVNYDPMSKSASFAPTVVLNPNTIYTFTIEGGATSTSVTDMVGNPLLEDYIVSFTTTSSADTQPPKIMYANGDEFAIAITFSESMNSAKVTDTTNWPTSVLKSSNYIIKYGNPATATSTWTLINISSSTIKYDATNNTVIIENLGLAYDQVMGKDYYIDMSTTSATDLSGNTLATVTTFKTPINNSSQTQGMLGPNMGGGGGMTGPNMGDMGMKKAGAFPMNAVAGQTTIYFIDIPTVNAISDLYQIVLTFPQGFNISGAKRDTNSPINNDINNWGTGLITFATSTESSGGANNDGVVVDTNTRTVIITLRVSGTTPTGDFLHLDLAGITNSSIARGFDTSGYSVDMKILDNSGNLKETISTMPFFINEAGTNTLSGSITLTGATTTTDGTMNIYLGSPMTGPMNQTITINDGTSTYAFTGLLSGSYMLFTDPVITINAIDWAGMAMPDPINITTSTTKNLTFAKQNSGNVLTLTVNLSGNFQGNDIDVFAGSPNGFRVKTITGAGVDPGPATLYLPAGDWMVGVGPAMPKGPMAGPPPMPDWMPPMPQLVKSNGTSTASVTLSISNANMNIIGYVTDGVATTSYPNGTPIADAEVYAYQPNGTGGMGSHTKTDTSGKFTLKIAQASNYTVGAFKPGLPGTPDKSVIVTANSGASDGNSTCDVTVDNKLITDANLFVIKMKKPSYTISGKVTNGTNPVSYAPVWANQANGFGHADSVTDSSGNYILYVDNGTWTVNSYIPGYGDTEAKTVVVSGANVIQNLAPDSATTYYTISGTITIGGAAQANMPIRAVQFNNSGVYTGKEYGNQTNSSGVYSISVPGSNKYRVDIWTPTYGEVALDTDEVANSPANVIVGTANVTGKDITIDSGNLITVTLSLTNKSGYSNKEGFVNIDGVSCVSSICKPNEFRRSLRIANLAGADQTIQLKASSNYFFMLDVPGSGRYTPILDANQGQDPVTGSIVATTTDRVVKFTLSNTSSTTATVSGTVTSGANNIANAWVWVGNPTNGYFNGTSTASNGAYLLTIPTGTGYKMGAEKMGYTSIEPITFNIATPTTTTQNFALVANTLTISGYIYNDANSNSAVDTGEAVPNGWVRAETTDGTRKAHSPVDANGYFELGVVGDSWKIYGMADGYLETYYGTPIAINSLGLTNKNIKLTADPNWSNKSKMKPIVPASGGTLDDTAADGTGVELTVPPNALGSSASTGNLTAAVTSAVGETNSNEPFSNEGVKITATDNSGQVITNLNDYVDFEKVLYKADVQAELAAGNVTYAKLKSMQNGYWDSTSNDWVTLSTTRTAYYKTSSGATEWTLYTNSTATDTYEAFIDTLSSGTTYNDYKLVFTSKTNHFTIFAVIMPFVAAAQAAPSTPSTPAGNVGQQSKTYCQTVIYGDWGTCSSGWQYRNVTSRTPVNCTLTDDQEKQGKKQCEQVGEEKNTLPETLDKIADKTKEAAEQFAQKIIDITNEAAEVIKANIGSFLEKFKYKRDLAKERNSINKYVRALIKNALSLKEEHKNALNNFLTYGTPTTLKLGEGERAGVVNSYKSAFGKLPTTETEWNDVIKIANGRWPSQINKQTEANAAIAFKKIYLRSPDRNNAHDDAAITIIAYGLRPASRNTNSEQAAIKTFKAIYGYQPSSATAWDIVRAIAYSGAKR